MAVKIKACADAIAQRDVSPPPAADQAEGPSVDDVAELCQEFGFVPGNNGALLTADVFRAPPLSPLPMLRDMITAAITRWPLPVARPITSDWQPIETAPRDGTLVLTISESRYPEDVISDNYKLCNFSFLQYNRIRDTWVDRLGSSGYSPTHWQPLPGPPNTINHPS